MGDSRIKIVISSDVLPKHHVSSLDDGNNPSVLIKQYPSDATLCDVCDDIRAIGVEFCSVSVWNCTIYPPQDITSLLQKFPGRSGTVSKTLYSAGFFPSAVWQVLKKGAEPRAKSVTEDSQYNRCENLDKLVPQARVQILSRSGESKEVKPSQILENVKRRFENDMQKDEYGARQARRQQKKERLAKEAARHRSLEDHIDKLNSLQSATSAQVRKMLIKSRCTGNKSLKEQDRLHFQIAVVNGEDVSEDFRYFSRQDTVARVISEMKPNRCKTQQAELLVTTSTGYRRLPHIMRLYEALNHKYIQEVDSLVVRLFPLEEEMTTNILQGDADRTEENVMQEKSQGLSEHETPLQHSQQEASPQCTLSQDLIDRFDDAISRIDENSKAKKSSTSSALKVRQMLMKSKAKGDKKRVSRMEDRFFVEIVSVPLTESSPKYVFVAKKDSLGRLVNEHVGRECKLYSVKEDAAYVELSLDEVLEDLEAMDKLEAFGRVVVHMADSKY
jgi:hypothetical protein